MPEKTIAQLEKEITDGRKKEKVLKERISKWKTEALEAKRFQKNLITQYERVIKEWKQRYNNLFDNAPKLFILWLIEKFKSFKERRKK